MILNLEKYIGKVAVVTGTSAGIGANIAKQLVEHGLIVAGLARRVDRIKALAEELKEEHGQLHAFKCDLTVEEDIINAFKQIIKKLGDIHVLVNNAGVLTVTDLINGDTGKWKTVMDTNFTALIIATREAVQDMKKKGTEGHIVHISSLCGHMNINMEGLNVYAASKYAVTGYTGTLINDLIREKLPIKVSIVSPGYVETEFQSVAEIPQENLPPFGLKPADITEAVIYVLAAGPKVLIRELIIQPTMAIY